MMPCVGRSNIKGIKQNRMYIYNSFAVSGFAEAKGS